MKAVLYNQLIKLSRVANDHTQTEKARQLASDQFEALSHQDPAIRQIVQNAIAKAPSIKASLLFTCSAALTDYTANKSFGSAFWTFFKVANTRLQNPSPVESPRPL